ncbi:DVU3141 family protein [Siccirubricoccus phaeus]|uniref:DVU3141 family protein n=1 Tax=Siccirubricoccus phaeus TaxID=2595053 RepID=UPI00165A960E|nr:DVU3141 family protein [Siccirubricoccus phaeus]
MLGLLLGGMALAGCISPMEGGGADGAATVLPASYAMPADPLLAFAANAAPGSESAVTLASGQTARVRLLRRYTAASGRECRELLIGRGYDERSRLVCQGETGWVEARPLLRAGKGRP